MAATVRSSAAQATGFTTTVDVTVPAGLADGDILYVFAGSRADHYLAPTTTAGWTELVGTHGIHVNDNASPGGFDARIQLWRRVISGTPPASFEFTFYNYSDDLADNDYGATVSYAVQGADTADPEDGTATTISIGDEATADDDTNTSVTLPQITATTADDRLLLTGADINTGGDGDATFQAVAGLTLDAQEIGGVSVATAGYSTTVASAAQQGPWTANIDQSGGVRDGRYAAITVLVNSAAAPAATEHVWDGTAWVDVSAEKVWDGTAWVT